MKINVKNNSTGNTQKIEVLKEFLRFCQINSPLKESINVVFVNNTKEKFFDGNYLVPTKLVKLNESINKISEFWVEEFSKQRRIKCVGIESKLLVQFFLESNPNFKNIINI